MTIKPHTVRYLIANDKSQFLTDLYNGKPSWSVAPHDAITTGHSWLDLASARAKCLMAERLLCCELHLALIDFARVDGRWVAVNQQGVPQ